MPEIYGTYFEGRVRYMSDVEQGTPDNIMINLALKRL